MTTQDFEYEPLGPDHIRLLRVVTCSDVWADCLMEPVSLDSSVGWAALSCTSNRHFHANAPWTLLYRPGLMFRRYYRCVGPCTS